MKKQISAILASTMLCVGASGGLVYSQSSKPTAYFFIPHQDDELLSFGSSIISHLNTGHDVKIVVFNDGAGSYVREQLGLSEEDFMDARDSEQISALKALGVKESNINYIPMRYPDNNLPNYKREVKSIMRHYMSLTPSAKVKTFTPYGSTSMHKDHRVLGEVAKELQNEGVIKDLRFYIEPYEVNNFKKVNPSIGIMNDKTSVNDTIKIKNACDCYRYSKYGIGYRSVGRYFDDFVVNQTNYIHK